MRLTLAFITGRAEPHLDWLLESIAPQVGASDEVNVIVIDMRGRTPADLGVLPNYGHWAPNVRVELPKPTPYQGAHRITTSDWWAKSNAMNTAFVLCETDYIAFTDDSCRVGPRWLDVVRRGYQTRASVLAGSYDKLEAGLISSDHRRERCPTGKVNCGGSWLFGCTFALPLEWALQVNGAEEGCDSMGTEDYTFGLMLANAGHRIDFVPDMMVTQERAVVSGPGPGGWAVRRTDKGVSPNDKSHAALRRFGSRRRTEFTPDLRELRARRAAGDLTWPLPDPEIRDWYDNQLVRELG